MREVRLHHNVDNVGELLVVGIHPVRLFRTEELVSLGDNVKHLFHAGRVLNMYHLVDAPVPSLDGRVDPLWIVYGHDNDAGELVGVRLVYAGDECRR